ncbi:MAG TPA: FxsA family protein [Acidimicrobiales bacterium]
MAALLFVLFVVVPLVEIYVFIVVASAIGVLPALAALLAVSFLGLWLVKAQGLGVLRRMQATVNRGEVPTAEVVDGGLLVSAGVLCIVPGFVTGAIGLLLLLPPLRAFVRNRLLARWGRDGGLGTGRGRVVGGTIVDVEYVGDVTPGPRSPTSPTELGPGR